MPFSDSYRDIVLGYIQSDITHVALATNDDSFTETTDISTLNEKARVVPTITQSGNKLVVNSTFGASSANCSKTTISGGITTNAFDVVSATGFTIGDRITVDGTKYEISNVSGSTITVSTNLNPVPTVGMEVKEFISQIHLVKDGTGSANSGSTAFVNSYNVYKESPQIKKQVSYITVNASARVQNFSYTVLTNDLVLPLGISAGLHYDSVSMLNASTTISDSSGNGNTGTLNGGVAIETDARWGKGLNFNSANRYISVPNSSSYKASGVNAKLAYISIVRLKAAGSSRLVTIRGSVGFETSLSVETTGVFLELFSRVSPNPYVIYYPKSIALSVDVDYGIATLVDLENETIDLVINQTSYSLTVSDLGAIYYPNITDFKTDGGIASTNKSLDIGAWGDVAATQYFKGIVWRSMIVKNTIPSVVQVKEMFLNIGLS